MTSRSAMLFSLFGLAAVAGGVLYFTQVRSTSTVAVPPAASATGAETATSGSATELAEPGTIERGTPTAQANKPAAAGNRQASDPKAPKPYAVSAPKEVAPEVLQPKASEVVMPETGAPKLPTLDPILGGVPAIQSKYTGSTYDERFARAEVLDHALGGAPSDPEHSEAYQALKDELIWLRANMGTPPAPK